MLWCTFVEMMSIITDGMMKMFCTIIAGMDGNQWQVYHNIFVLFLL